MFRDDENRLFLIQAFVEKLEAEEPHINCKIFSYFSYTIHSKFFFLNLRFRRFTVIYYFFSSYFYELIFFFLETQFDFKSFNF